LEYRVGPTRFILWTQCYLAWTSMVQPDVSLPTIPLSIACHPYSDLFGYICHINVAFNIAMFVTYTSATLILTRNKHSEFHIMKYITEYCRSNSHNHYLLCMWLGLFMYMCTTIEKYLAFICWYNATVVR